MHLLTSFSVLWWSRAFLPIHTDWVLCRLSALGMLQQLLVDKDRPSLDRIGEILQAEEKKSGDSFFNKLSTFIDRSLS